MLKFFDFSANLDTFLTIDFYFFFSISGSILESKDMGAIFQKTGKEMLKTEKYLKISAKIYKLWKYFEKGQVIDKIWSLCIKICILIKKLLSARG